MANKYAGEWPLTVGKKLFKICFTWERVAEAQSVLGIEAVAKLSKIGALSPVEISQLLHIGLKEYHPDMTEAAIMKLSPPIAPTLFALDRAIALAFFGPSLTPEKEDKLKKPSKKDAKKKTSLKKR